MKKIIGLVFFILFYSLISFILLFYLDLANGPMYLLFMEIGVIIGGIALRIINRNKKVLFCLFPFLFVFLLNIPILMLAKPKVETFYPVSEIKETEVLELENGKIVGTLNSDETVRIYAGIPYAKAPVGDLRFKEPVDSEDWDGIKECFAFAPRAMQVDTNPAIATLIDMYAQGSWHPDYKMHPVQDMSEDCLYLNIWRPNTNEDNLPILVYIHGGSLTNGSSAFGDYNGETYAKNGVIMITISYRLNVFGYFASNELINESPNNTTGNYGLLDQIKALEWVNNNATYFGGDKNNITIAGESAGSSSVSALCSSPLAKGLFQKAIGESSSLVVKKAPHTFRSLEEAIETGNAIMEEFNSSSVDDLRKIDAKKLVNTKYTNSGMTIDGYALTKTPYEVYKNHENNEIKLLNGYNVKESDAFVVPAFLFSKTNKNNIEKRLTEYFNAETSSKLMALYQDEINDNAAEALYEIMSVYWFIYPHHSWSNMALSNGEDVYRYQFTKENGHYGTYHSGEMIYVYGNIYRSIHPFAYDDSDLLLEENMVKYFTNFIKTGDPNGDGLPRWEKYDPNQDTIMELGDNIGLISDRYLELYPILIDYINSVTE